MHHTDSKQLQFRPDLLRSPEYLSSPYDTDVVLCVPVHTNLTRNPGADQSVFLPIVIHQRVCPGIVVTRTAQLAPLRFCTYIDGNLTLSVTDNATNSQFNVFSALGEIKGACG